MPRRDRRRDNAELFVLRLVAGLDRIFARAAVPETPGIGLGTYAKLIVKALIAGTVLFVPVRPCALAGAGADLLQLLVAQLCSFVPAFHFVPPLRRPRDQPFQGTAFESQGCGIWST